MSNCLQDAFKFFLEKGSKEENINLQQLGEIMKKFGESPTENGNYYS